MRPYFEKMQEWNKPVKVNAKNAEEIKKVEADIAERVEKAKKAGISAVVFDRGGFIYHGRIKELAEAAREAGLEF